MATIYYPTDDSCVNVFEAYACSPCLEREFARIRGYALVAQTALLTDWTSSAQWATAINALNAFVYTATQGEYDGGETEETDGYGDNAFDNGNTTHSISIFDPRVRDNVDHWNYIKSRRDLVPVIKTDTRIWVFSEPCIIKVKLPIANDIKAIVRANILLKLVQDDIPTPYATPGSIFTTCSIAQ